MSRRISPSMPGLSGAAEEAEGREDALRARLKQALAGGGGSLREALLGGGGVSSPPLAAALRPLIGQPLATRVAELAEQTEGAAPPRPLGEFESRAASLMAAGRWIEAHDVVEGLLLEASGGGHLHEATLAARLLEGMCQHELANAAGLAAALSAYEEEKDSPLQCGCVLAGEVVEPYSDLATALHLVESDANAALGHALCVGLTRPALLPVAAQIAARAEAALEPLEPRLLDGGDADSGGGEGEAAAGREAAATTGDQADEAADEAADEDLTALDELEGLVGLREAKAHCRLLRDAVALEKERGDDPKLKSLSLVLTGSPGTGKTAFALLYARLLGELEVLPSGRVVRVTGAQLQDGGVEALEEVLKGFDEPGEGGLQVGDVVEARREGTWGHFGRIVRHDTSPRARPPYKDSYDIHFGGRVRFELSDGTSVSRRDNDFDIGVRRKDIRAKAETGGVLILDDAHQLSTSEKAARQVLYRLTEEMDARGGRFAVVVAGYEKQLFTEV